MDNLHQHEKVTNGKLAELIERVMYGRQTYAETSGILPDKASKQPDITITAKGRSPVVIEAKYMREPENKVEEQAREHVGESVDGETHPIEAAIALRYPAKLEQPDNIGAKLKATNELRYCAVYPQGKRFPTTGWLKGSVCDLADLIHLVDVPESAFDKCAEDLEKSIDEAVSHFPSDVVLINKIFKLLGLTEDPKAKDLSEYERRKLKRTQTGRIAGAILANALLFHERIANTREHIQPIHQLFCQRRVSAQKAALKAWDDILEINYWPIFDASRQIIDLLDAGTAGKILQRLADEAERIQEQGLLYENDLTGHVFQRLIIDRKYLAAFYTLPTSAALLANLAVAKMKDIDWSDADKIGELKIADFACGTGALLSAVYDQIANRYERVGGDPADLHKALMEKVFHGFDVVHYATCLTASILSGKQPGIIYDDTWFCTMPYGRQEDKTVQIGSLEFLDKPEQRVLFHTGNPAKQVGSKVEATIPKVEVPDNEMDLVIMNPPFTRAANHGGEHANIVNPAFAAFGATKEDMKEMGARMRDLGKKTCYDGKAGLASAFAAIANKKLKPGGILALVLPLVSAIGQSWKKFRALIAKDYTDIEVISIADAKIEDISFSAFTGLGECLVIARKKNASISSQSSASATRFVSLLQRPAYLAASGEIAKQLTTTETERQLEDGPFGGTDINCGFEKMGETIQSTVSKTKPKWNPVRIQDFELIQTAYKLTQGKLHLPRRKAKPLAMTALSNVGMRGVVHRLIIGPPYPAPFYQTKSTPKPTDTYPALWNHEAKREHYLICHPDRQLKAEKGQEERANELWHRIAGRAHLNLDFRFNAQPLAVAFTSEPCIGGTAWPNVNFAKKSWDYAFALWGNSTLGLLLFWWHSSRQDSGRGRTTISAIETLPVLDFRALSKTQLQKAKRIFDEFKDKHFLPAYVADIDKTRAELDHAVLCEWLGFDKTIYQAVRQLASRWCAEPSVHGGKARPH